jgi:hypothetical protein
MAGSTLCPYPLPCDPGQMVGLVVFVTGSQQRRPKFDPTPKAIQSESGDSPVCSQKPNRPRAMFNTV